MPDFKIALQENYRTHRQKLIKQGIWTQPRLNNASAKVVQNFLETEYREPDIRAYVHDTLKCLIYESQRKYEPFYGRTWVEVIEKLYDEVTFRDVWVD